MKIKKLEGLMRAHVWLANYLAERRHIYGYKRGNPDCVRRFRDYVRQNVSYVAFRPWDSLNFMDGTTKKSEQITERGHMLHQCVDYEVLWHSDATSPFQERVMFHHATQTPSVGQLIGGIVTFRVNYPDRAKEIHIDAVVRHSYTHSTLIGDYTNERWEVFLCPKDWMLPWVKADKQLYLQLQAKGIRVQGLSQVS
jgi:hypothetical protein